MVFFLQIITFIFCVGFVDVKDTSCCVSKRFNAQVRVLSTVWDKDSSQPKITENIYQVDSDYDLKMDTEKGMVITYKNGEKSTYQYTTINDYNSMKSYYLFNNTGQCSVDNITGEAIIPHCLPSYLHMQSTENIGSLHNPMHAQVWEGTKGNTTERIITSSFDCTPISTTAYGITAKGETFSTSLLYSNYSQYQLSSPDVFNIPAACIKETQPVGK